MNKFQIKTVKDALDRDEDLTEWEAAFVDNLASKGDDYELSDKQNRVLNRIRTKLDFG